MILYALDSLFEFDVPNAMPFKRENSITSYFYRVSPDAKSKVPIQSNPGITKRARTPDEIDSATKAKKLKSQQCTDTKGHAVLHAPSSSSWATFGKTAFARDIIQTQDASPFKAISYRSTPPSSPLPDLTPSPEASQFFSHLFSSREVVDDPEVTSSRGASTEASCPGSQEVDSDPIPSSQTQTIDSSNEDEDLEISQNTALPMHIAPVRSPQISNYIPSSQPDSSPTELLASQYQFVPSSQSQFMDPTPSLPSIPDFDDVPSSQSQELSYSQYNSNSPKKGSGTRYWPFCLDHFPFLNFPTSSSKQTSLVDVITDESETRAQSPENDENLVLGTSPGGSRVCFEGPHLPITIPSSQTPTYMSRLLSPNPEGEKESSPQLTQDCCSDREDSYESLPDVLEHFRGMFGKTFESLPPDFPQSLRF